MAQAVGVQTAREPQPPRNPIRWWTFRLPRRQSIALSCLIILCVVWVGVLTVLWPFTRKAVIKALQVESEREVRIRSFHPTFFPPGYEAEELRFDSPNSDKGRPSFTIRKLALVGSYSDLFFMRKRIKRVVVSGFHLLVPAEPPSERQSQEAPDKGEGKPRFSEIGEIDFDDAVVDFLSAEKDAQPLRMTFQKILLNDIDQTHPASFRLEVATSEPRGVIHATGKLGPWNWNETGNSSLSGTFIFAHGDLSVFDGIGGYLKAGGKFSGPLRRVVCNGSLEVPDFHVSGSAHEVSLSTTFRAVVNGLNADTTLEYVQSHFGETSLLAQGTIKGASERAGKDTSLRLTIDGGQIADLLLLFTENTQPSMTGAVSLRADVELPSGPAAFLRKLEASGDFGIDNSRFTKAGTQRPIDHLSESAQGLNKKEERNDNRVVLSNLRGHISAKGGVATLSSVRVEVPGAQATLSGTYDLLQSSVNLKGVLRTTGKLSHTTNGVKSAALKVLTPFLKKRSVTTVPFTITGPARNPSLALDLKAKRRE